MKSIAAAFALCLATAVFAQDASYTNVTVTNTLSGGSASAPSPKWSLTGSNAWGLGGIAMYIDNHHNTGIAGLRLNARGNEAARGGAFYQIGPSLVREGALAPNSTVLIAYEPAGLSLVAANPNAGDIRFYTKDDWPSMERMRITHQGKIGIGTAAPYYALDISAASNPAQFPNTPVTIGLYDRNGFATPGAGAGIGFGGVYNAANQVATWAVISGIRESAQDGNYAGALTFGTRPNGNQWESIERMRLTSTGELIVHGDVTVNGNLTARYQDIAEWVPANGDLGPGTVVVLRPGAVNEVTASHAPYDTTVAGVVSARPGLILGEAGEGKQMIATTGRVRVRVDATAHPIAVGDLLVTSGKKGTAMYSSPVEVAGVKMHRPGTIIGKALEPLASGEGEILVLLSMQ